MTSIVCSQNSRAGIVFSGIKERLLLQNLNMTFCGSKVYSKTEEVDSEVQYSLFYSALCILRKTRLQVR